MMKMVKSRCFEICITGHLSGRWSDWFEGLAIHNDDNGMTVLSGSFVDQAALFGVLTKLQALNLELISVNRVPD